MTAEVGVVSKRSGVANSPAAKEPKASGKNVGFATEVDPFGNGTTRDGSQTADAARLSPSKALAEQKMVEPKEPDNGDVNVIA